MLQKVFNQRMADFKDAHLDMITKISSCGDCISETDFNQLLADNSAAMHKHGRLSVSWNR